MLVIISLQAHLKATSAEAQTKAFKRACKYKTQCKRINELTTYILTFKNTGYNSDGAMNCLCQPRLLLY
jgi:hypothetical protein